MLWRHPRVDVKLPFVGTLFLLFILQRTPRFASQLCGKSKIKLEIDFLTDVYNKVLIFFIFSASMFVLFLLNL